MSTPPSRTGRRWAAAESGQALGEVMGIVTNEVAHTGINVSVSALGYYRVTAWHTLKGGGRMQDVEYDHLTWDEALDVIHQELTEHRPGWALGAGWSQPPLPL